MSDYTSTFTEGTGDTIDASDFSTEFDAIETAIATKFDKGSTLSGNYAGGALTSQTYIDVGTVGGNTADFTSIPTWAKKINIILSDVSGDNTGNLGLRIGDGSIVTSGYTGVAGRFGTTTQLADSNATDRWIVSVTTAASELSGIITLINITGNTWVVSGQIGDHQAGTSVELFNFSNGFLTLSGALDRLRLLWSVGNYDAGSINIIYEG